MSDTAAQATRVAAALSVAGYTVELIHDVHSLPLVVVLRHVFCLREMQPIISAAEARIEAANVKTPNEELAVVPFGTRSEKVYPRSICDVLDLAVRAINEDGGISATRLYAPEGGRSIGLLDIQAHTDFPGNLDDPPRDEIHGFNVHVTMRGVSSARFSLMPSFDRMREIRDVIRSAKAEGKSFAEINSMFPAFYGDAMQRATPPVESHAGDILLFQARPHERKGLLPVVHEFETSDGDRWHNIFVPKAGPANEIDARRAKLVERYGLETLGYDKSPVMTGL